MNVLSSNSSLYELIFLRIWTDAKLLFKIFHDVADLVSNLKGKDLKLDWPAIKKTSLNDLKTKRCLNVLNCEVAFFSVINFCHKFCVTFAKPFSCLESFTEFLDSSENIQLMIFFLNYRLTSLYIWSWRIWFFQSFFDRRFDFLNSSILLTLINDQNTIIMRIHI